MNIYEKKLKGYESIEGERIDSDDIISKILKFIIFFIIILIIGLVAFYFFRTFNLKKSNIDKGAKFVDPDHNNGGQLSQLKPQETKKYSISNFKDIIPKIDLKGSYPKSINEVFKSRRLFINENNITNNYIQFLRPINQQEEEKYNQKTELILADKDYLYFRQTNLIDYYTYCDKETLIEPKQKKISEEPLVSVIVSLINNKIELIKSINSIQSQTFKNIEIIIVNDCPEENTQKMLEYLFENEHRIRIFKHSTRMGLWRSRLDGFLYSTGKYILHFDAGDIFADPYIVEDMYNLFTKYNLDSVRFSFSKTRYHYYFSKAPKFSEMKLYPKKHNKIIYGRPDFDVHIFGYGTICNRIFRANMFVKGLDLIDEIILNAKKDLWEDMWWNDLIDRVSFSNLAVNRLGYIYLYDRNSPSEPKLRDNFEKDKTIREFIYFWLFDYQLLPKEDNKKMIINTLYNFIKSDNTISGMKISLDFLLSNSPIYDYLLTLLYNDPYVSDKDKQFVTILYNKAPKNK